MKILIALLLLISLTGYADEMPSWWHLPSKGKHCFQTGQFQAKATDCGVKKLESWTCVEPSGNDFTRATKTDYLLDGIYETDFANDCFPTYVVKKVIKQK